MVSIVKQDVNQADSREGAIFEGQVLGQDLVSEADAPQLRVTAITFVDGARNVWHRHSSEQVLVVTAGEGIIADSAGEHAMAAGDVVLIQPNERHWHGAASGRSMTHLSILLPSEMSIDDTEI